MALAKQLHFIHQDPVLGRILGDQLAAQGYGLSEAVDLEGGVPAGVDLILLDGLADATTLCRDLRAQGAPPVLVLAGSAAESRDFLTAGAADCLVKPVRLSVLASRIEALLQVPLAEADITIGPLIFQPTARQARTPDGQRIALTEKETDILLYLHRATERVVPREELLGVVWGYAAEASTHTVETHIYRLRRKLGEGVLLTEPGGYRLA